MASDAERHINADVTKNKPTRQIHHFVDEIWFLIFSFLTKKEGFYGFQEAIGSLFFTIGHASREDYLRLVRYIQTIPQSYSFDSRRISKLDWACTNRMSLGHVDFWGIRTNYDLNLCIHLLLSCSIAQLHTFHINLSQRTNFVTYSRNDTKRIVVDGVPAEVLHVPQDAKMFQKNFSRCIAGKVKKLEKMYICVRKNELYAPFITNFSETLVDLSLAIHCGGKRTKSGSLDEDLEEISHAIERLSLLKRLTIIATPRASFRIRSRSLEEIDTSYSQFGFWVDECICPLLQVFVMNLLKNGVRNGVMPVSEITDRRHIVVGSCPFVGMQVPDSCIVCLEN